MATSHFMLLLFLSLSSLSLLESCHPNDKRALLQIKKDLNNPSVLNTWNPNTDCCRQWSAVTCNHTTNRVIEIYLYDTNLNLPIPAAVGDLPYLQGLNFRNTSATGPIPQAISKLSQLDTLDLEHNLLTGPIPTFLGNLKKLTYVGLSSNRLTGSIPVSLSQLPNLQSLFLHRNRLTGSIPESFEIFKHPQFQLDVSRNQLSGTIPRKLGSANFWNIRVSRNFLEGDISFLFGKNKKMMIGDFSRNKFAFDLTKVEFSQSLTNLDLSHNKIYGGIPKDLSSTGIIALNVSYNSLCGPIPELRYKFQNFDASVFSHNKCLCGKPLPACK